MNHRMNGLAVILTACATAVAAGAAEPLQPVFSIASFSNPLIIDNVFWPLPVGLHVVFHEVSGDECVVEDFVVTGQTRDFSGPYAGLTARVITDQAWLDEDCDGGRDVLIEDTLDWYAQDDAGNVWYFGEDTTEFLFDDEGNATGSSKEGSWEAGVDGASAGLIMLAAPTPGSAYQQELYAGVAEDRGKVQRVNLAVETGLGEFTGCLEVKEWSPLSPGLIERKTYCPDIGLVLVEGFGQEHHSAAEAVLVELP